MDQMEMVSARAEDKLMTEESEKLENKSSDCSSWVIELEKMLVGTDRSAEMVRWNTPSIYRVPEWVKDMTDREAYRPQLVSLGPFHHGEPNLLPMEEHKRRAVLHHVKRIRKPLSVFVTAVEDVVADLQSAYCDLDDKWRGTSSSCFVEMMVTDGCFLLELMMTENTEDYANNDPIFSESGFHYLWPYIRTDMLVMENQLPLLVLQTLLAVSRDTPPSAQEINEMVLNFLERSLKEGIDQLRLHPLDIFHKSFCCPCPRNQGSKQLSDDLNTLSSANWGTAPSAVDLSEAGIHFKVSNTESVNDVEFEEGVLSMPKLLVYDETKKAFLNLMVFERLHPSTGTDVMDYIYFMDDIIDSAKDVALLRTKGLLSKGLGSDQEIADLFNTLSDGTVMSPHSKLTEVHQKMSAHCEKRMNKWRAYFVQTYLRNPWKFMSLVAAAILVVSAILQTVYTIVSFYAKS